MKISRLSLAIKLWSVVGILFLFGGCVTTVVEPFSMPDAPPPGYATLIVYRATNMGALQKYSCYVNDTLIARLGPSAYSYTYVKEGQHRVRWAIYTGESRDDSSIRMVAGESYYYRMSLERLPIVIPPLLTSIDTTHGNFVPPEAAMEELATKSYVQADVPLLEQ